VSGVEYTLLSGGSMRGSVVRTIEKIEFAVVRRVLSAMERIDRARRARAGQAPLDRSPHPEIRALLKLQQLVMPKEKLSRDPVARRIRARRDARVFDGARVRLHKITDLTIDSTPPLRARHYVPDGGSEPAPLIVYFHGGGFVIGDLDTHDAPCRTLCKESGAHVLAIDYRLAPEHAFPAAVEDAVAAYEWARAHADQLHVDPDRIAVAGDSAGANLATVVTQLAVKAQKPAPFLQLLFYPTVDRTIDRASVELFADGYFLTRSDVEWYTEQYVPRRADLFDPRVSPLLATDLRGQSPAIVVTAGFDPLRDEGDAYAEALRAADNEVHIFHLTDLVHGFINMGALSEYAHTTLVEVAHATRDRLRRVST
jgi:acetyl esterase